MQVDSKILHEMIDPLSGPIRRFNAVLFQLFLRKLWLHRPGPLPAWLRHWRMNCRNYDRFNRDCWLDLLKPETTRNIGG